MMSDTLLLGGPVVTLVALVRLFPRVPAYVLRDVLLDGRHVGAFGALPALFGGGFRGDVSLRLHTKYLLVIYKQ